MLGKLVERSLISPLAGTNLAYVASVSVVLGSKESQRNGISSILPAHKMVQEPKTGKRGRGRKEMLADKPLDFENRPLDLSCVNAHTKISCLLSELSRTCQNMSET